MKPFLPEPVLGGNVSVLRVPARDHLACYLERWKKTELVEVRRALRQNHRLVPEREENPCAENQVDSTFS